MHKTWRLDELEPELRLNSQETPLDANGSSQIRQFLSLITFRYIPNRVIPIEIIRQEQLGLRDVLVRRLAKQRKQSEAVFQGLKETAETLVASLSAHISNCTPDVTKVSLATAESLADLAFQFGYKLVEGSVEMDEAEQGSGMQSLLMFETLHLIDRDYFQRFGWKQAAIWAVEEPESSLNTVLEAHAAFFLRRIASDRSGRLQILGTTHSDLMIQYADRGYFVDKQKSSSQGLLSTVLSKSTRELLEASSMYGVSRYVNPLLMYPLEPLVLVEGKFDRDFLIECFRIASPARVPRISCLGDLKNEADKGGVDALLGYIKENVTVIKHRSRSARVIVLLDWDSSNKVKAFYQLFHTADPFACLAWDPANANPSLSDAFRGVERFYPDRIIKGVAKNVTDLFFTNEKGVITVDQKNVGTVKRLLNAEVKKGLEKGDEIYVKNTVDILAKLIRNSGEPGAGIT